MDDAVTISIKGRHGSISDLVWPEVPPLAVLTGVNGAGKSQLLEVIAASYNALLRSRDGFGSPPRVEAETQLWSGDRPAEVERGSVLHAYDEWVPQGAGEAREEDITRLIVRMHQEVLEDVYGTTSIPPSGRILASDRVRRLVRAGVTFGESRPTVEELYEQLTPKILWDYASVNGPASLPLLFLSYRLFEREALGRGESPEDIRVRFGEPPWELLDEILDTSGLPLRAIHPEPARPTGLFRLAHASFRLRDLERGIEVPFDGLSSGEKVIMSTAIWRYAAEQGAGHPKLLLLDEPDAHLHPSLARRFLNVIREVFVRQRGVRVIMTTHSPSTVALVPEESLFEMRRTEPRVAPAASKERLIAVLTDGFVAVQEATQTVLLEGKDDAPFYGQVWDLLTERSAVAEPGPLEPYPNVSFVYGHGKETVVRLVLQMRAAGMAGFHGIVDRDLGNAPSEGVRVLARNGMENYLYDPLNVWTFLHSQDRAPDVEGVAVPRGSTGRVKSLPEAELQRIADTVLAAVAKELGEMAPGEQALEGVSFINGKHLSYPRWFLYRDDKEIKSAFTRAYGQNVLKPGRPEGLLRSYATLNMVPNDLLGILRGIQVSGSP